MYNILQEYTLLKHHIAQKKYNLIKRVHDKFSSLIFSDKPPSSEEKCNKHHLSMHLCFEKIYNVTVALSIHPVRQYLIMPQGLPLDLSGLINT